MDGRGTLPGRRLARTWSLETWQAIAYFALAALLVSNAAWFYRSRVVAVETAAMSTSPAPPAPREVIEYRYAPGAFDPTTDPADRSTSPAAPLAPNERCMNGDRVRVDGHTYTRVGDC